MGAVEHLAQGRRAQKTERWREVDYKAIDAMIEKLTMESAGKTFEELSDLLQQEGRAVTGALLGEVLRSCGAAGRVPHGRDG